MSYKPLHTSTLNSLDGNISLGAPIPNGTPVKVGSVDALQIDKRMSIEDMRALQTEYGTEFAQIYLTGPGRNGRGGTYYLIQGNEINTPIPVGNNVRLINHTHPEIFRGQVLPLRALMI